jgi:hypothetical protein
MLPGMFSHFSTPLAVRDIVDNDIADFPLVF